MADYFANKQEKEVMDRVFDRMHKRGLRQPKYVIQALDYLETELCAAEAELAETKEKLLHSQEEVAQVNKPQQTDLTSALETVKRFGWKPLSISFTESGVEITLE